MSVRSPGADRRPATCKTCQRRARSTASAAYARWACLTCQGPAEARRMAGFGGRWRETVAANRRSHSLHRVSWTVDVAVSPPPMPPLPGVLAAAVSEAVARPAAQQPAWPGLGEGERGRWVLESVPPIAVPAEVDRLQERLGMVARGGAFLLPGG